MTKTCTSCRLDKKTSEFWRDQSKRDGLQVYCKPCLREKNDRFRAENPERVAKSLLRSHLRRLYGMTLEDYEALMAVQGGRCAVCRGLPPPHARRLYVDHDHLTGHVRGLLCQNCNVALGAALDNPGLLRAMADYLELTA